MFSALVFKKNLISHHYLPDSYESLCGYFHTLQGRLINVKVNPDNVLIIVMWGIFLRNSANNTRF